LARYSEKSINKITTQNLSYFTTNQRPTAIKLDHLDELAGYFRLSIGELLGVSKPGELSGDEQRVVHAFRVLPPNLQDDILGILEGLSIGARFAGTSMPASSVSHVGQRRAPHGDDLPASNSFGPVDAGVVAIADEFARRVADLLRGTAPREHSAGTRTPRPDDRPGDRLHGATHPRAGDHR
jgi:hypothetical protein